jgi:hypothetical protein
MKYLLNVDSNHHDLNPIKIYLSIYFCLLIFINDFQINEHSHSERIGKSAESRGQNRAERNTDRQLRVRGFFGGVIARRTAREGSL